jgi:hypothetical protein
MAVAVPDIEDRQDVGVRERSNRVRFALESRERSRVCCDGGWDDLDRDVAISIGHRGPVRPPSFRSRDEDDVASHVVATVTTTFPRLCPSSTYWMAFGTSRKG